MVVELESEWLYFLCWCSVFNIRTYLYLKICINLLGTNNFHVEMYEMFRCSFDHLIKSYVIKGFFVMIRGQIDFYGLQSSPLM